MSDTYCDYPWEHIYVQTSGHIKVCCLSNEHIVKDDGYHQFNLSKDPLFSFWNSEHMKNVRKKMLDNEKLSMCKRCYNLEDKGMKSMRISKKLELHKLKTLHGETSVMPQNIELHFGNVCNLSCRMCSQMFSHSVGKELLKISAKDPDFLKWVKKESGVLNNWTGELEIVYDWFKNTKIKKEIFESIAKNTINLTLVGGEPTAIKEFYELLEYLYEKDKLKDMSLMVVTNLTNTNNNLIKWFKELKKLCIYGSIDGLNERNEYIRYPSKWSQILQSMNFYAELLKNTSNSFTFGPTFQLLNIDQLTDIILFCENFANEKNIKYQFNWTSLVVSPRIYDYMIAPRDYKDYLIDKLYGKIKNVKVELHRQQILAHIINLEKITEVDPFLIKSFISYNDLLDSHRKCKSWRVLLPKLEESFNNFLS